MKQMTIVLTLRVPDYAADTDVLDDLAEELSRDGYGWVMLQRDNRTLVRDNATEREMRGREVWSP